jgi:hypothetical protein
MAIMATRRVLLLPLTTVVVCVCAHGKLPLLLIKPPQDKRSSSTDIQDITQIRHAFEQTLAELHNGDPQRPLFLPRQKAIQAHLIQLDQDWQQHFSPNSTSY